MNKDDFFIVGKNSVLDAINNDYSIIEIYVDNAKKIIKNNYKFYVKDTRFFNQFIKTNHQGYVAKIKSPSIYDIDTIKRKKPSKILVLDHIQDVNNFGAIIRTANAFGFEYIIYPKDRAAKLTSQVIKVSSGGFVNTKFIKVSSISSTLNYLKDLGYWIYVSALTNNSVSVKKIEFHKPLVLVVGNEAKGCSIPVIRTANQIINIPMSGSVQSLNVSVATGILLHESSQ